MPIFHEIRGKYMPNFHENQGVISLNLRNTLHYSNSKHLYAWHEQVKQHDDDACELQPKSWWQESSHSQ